MLLRPFLANLLVFFAFALPELAAAQAYPGHASTTVNDYANVLDDGAERDLDARLTALKRAQGIEMSVLTLTTQSDFAPNQTLEAFATGLFNAWGIGNAQRNDGILVVVLVEDRAMRIELGLGYARDWDATAGQVVDRYFLRHFAEGDYQTGILTGSEAVIREIAIPFHEGLEAPVVKDDGIVAWGFIGFFIVGVALVNGRDMIGDRLARLRRCPRCGRRGLRQSRRVTLKATKTENGLGKKHIRCVHCDYEEESTYYIAVLTNRSSSGFSGGRSGGGGASGRW